MRSGAAGTERTHDLCRETRREILALVEAAVSDGARRAAACAELGLHHRRLTRWQNPEGALREDGRPLAERPAPANRLSEAGRQLIPETCNLPEFASQPPSQIVPRLADRGQWTASEASFHRILRAAGQNHRRGRARRPSRAKPPSRFEAKGPCQVWSRDVTWLPGPIAGRSFHLYLMLDIRSRKIVGWKIHERETAKNTATLLERTIRAGKCVTRPVVLHADNGSPMKGATMRATMERLGVTASFSRPRVSNEIPVPRRCSGPENIGPTGPRAASPRSKRRGTGFRVLRAGIMAKTITARSASSPPRPAITARTATASRSAFKSTKPRARPIPKHGQAARGTGSRSPRPG